MLSCRGWLSNPDLPIFATSVFAFHTEQQQHQTEQLVPASSVARTTLRVTKPTVLRVAAEPAVASDTQLKLRVFPETAAAANGSNSSSSSSSSSSSKELVTAPLPPTSAIAEATDNNLFALLQPGSYLLAFEGSEPFLTTIGELTLLMV